ncbi:MAG: hypothetical protein GXO10_02920 [Crenarchaeota archaeon]|nr:hypothetical protein [Thermoproteota archaeon]
MSALSRVGDIGVGVCVCHDHPKHMIGLIATGVTSVSTCYSMQSAIGDIVLGACGHPGIIVSCLTNSSVEGRGMAHIGSVFVGCFNGIVTTGCGSTSGGR